MRDANEEIRQRGARVVVVGNGGPHFAKAFVEEQALPFEVYVDPSLATYRAAGLRRGAESTFRLSVIKSSFRAMKNGHFQGTTKGDPWQQGGVFVIGAGPTVHYAYVSDEAGDHPPVSSLLDALARAA